MSHPHNEHRDHKVQERRVGHITGGHGSGGRCYATGGAVHGDEAEDKAMVKRMVKSSSLKADGHKGKHRQDRPKRKAGGVADTGNRGVADLVSDSQAAQEAREAAAHRTSKAVLRAKGGRVHKGKGHTSVNVIVAPQGGHAGLGPMPGAAVPPVPPPRALAPPMPPPGGAPGGPPGMPPPMPHHSGGAAYASGGAVKSGPTWKEGLRNGTQVQHRDGKDDGKDIGRGKVITYKTGGAVFSNGKPGAQMAPHLPSGSGGGEARLFKERRAAKNYHAPAHEVNGAR